MLQGIPNLSLSGINHVVVQGGKVSLPVDPSALVYSHLTYVSGVPAPEGTRGVDISRLNILDALIGQLNQLREGRAEEASLSDFFPSNYDGTVESIIVGFNDHVRQARADAEAFPYLPAPDASPGILLNISI